MPDCITVSKIGREERIIYGDTVFNCHILIMIRRKPLIWWETRGQIDEIWSSNDRRSSILTPSSFTQETGVSILSDIQNVTSEIGPIQTFAVNLVIIMASTQNLPMKLVMLYQKHVSRTGTSNYILQIQRGVITCPCLWYLLQAQHSSNIDTDRTFPRCKHGVWCNRYRQVYCKHNTTCPYKLYV